MRSACDQPKNVADALLQKARAATTSAKPNRSKRPEFYARHLNEIDSDRLRLETQPALAGRRLYAALRR